MRKLKRDAAKAMDFLDIPAADQARYAARLS